MVAINEDPEVTRYLPRTVDPAAAAFYLRGAAGWRPRPRSRPATTRSTGSV
jgi:hypothetical protein